MSYAPETGYEVAVQPNTARKGVLRFEEGIQSDTDLPMEFGLGAYGEAEGSVALGWPTKSEQDTMRERAHVGSASWIEAPQELSEFVQGASMDHPTFERVAGSEVRINRWNPTRIG